MSHRGKTRRTLRRASATALIAVVSLVLLAWAHPGIGLAQGVSGYSEQTGTLSVGVGATATGTVSCPSGDVVLSGGYYQPLTFIYITESAPANSSGTGWSIGVDNLTGEAVSVDMYAVCAHAPPSYSVQTAACSSTSPCTLTCPVATEVTGGGYSYSGAITANGSFPAASNQWRLTYSFSSGSITDEAVCAQPPDGYVQESASSGASSGLVNIPCPGGTVVIGGGGNEGPDSAQNPGWNAPIVFGPALASTQWSFGSGASGAPVNVAGWAICTQQQPPPPTVTSVSPASGPVAGGTTVVITGTNLAGATAVTFGTAGQASITNDTATQVTAISPPGAAGAVDVTVTTAGGTSAQGAGDKFTYAVAPTVGLTCSPGTVEVGVATQCVATATNPTGSGAGPPTGTVRFTSDTTGAFGGSGACTLAGSAGSSTCELSYTPLARGSGTHRITAAYGGDATHAAGSTGTQINVTLRATRGSAVCAPSSVTVANSSVCDVTVTDAGGSGATAPTGTVTFASSGQGAFSSSAACTLANVGAGSAGCAVSYTPSAVGSGTHTITGSYNGDAVHSGVSAAAQIAIGPAGLGSVTPVTPVTQVASLGVLCSPSVLTAQQQTTCTVTATGSAVSGEPPTGQVVLASPDGQFANGGTCQLSPAGGASAACSLLFTAARTGTITITARLGSSGAHASTTVASPPTAGRTAAVTATGGTVLIKVGNRFVPLGRGATLVATGATIDARKGSITLTTAADGRPPTSPAHRLSNATLSAGIFTIEQQAAQNAQSETAPTDLVLVTPPKAIAAARCTRTGPPRKGVVRMLTGVVKGVYRVHAGASTTSMNSGAFTIQDRCDGTLTRITKGRARVTITKGPHRHHEVTLTAGQTLLVQARQFAAKQIAARHHSAPSLASGAASDRASVD